MIHTYKLTGMHCASCVDRVRQALESIDGVKKAIVSLQPQEAVVNMSHHISTAELNKAVQTAGDYSLSDEVEMIDTMGKPSATHVAATSQTMPADEVTEANWLTTYKPLLLVFGYILGAVLLVEWRAGAFDWMRAMKWFMAGFFLVFSFFKMLDIPAFASSYRMYDVVAKQFPAYGRLYPFIELALGVAYLTNVAPLFTNWVTLVVMSVSLVGVVQSVLNKRKIQCACLGAVFNLPMSTVTIIEDSLMIGMAALMLFAFP